MSMLSRVASNLFWLGRYLERAENTARIINVNSNLLLDLPRNIRLGWGPIVDIVSSHEEFDKAYDEVNEDNVISFMVADSKNPSSISSALELARENARTIREIIPREAWEQINSLYLLAKESQEDAFNRRHRYTYLNKIILANQTITGLMSGAMTHDEGYDFLRLGRNLERADMTTRIIDVRSASLLLNVDSDQAAFDTIQWMSVLKSLSAYQMYRREMRIRISRPDVLRFLLQEEKFPRSLKHALQQVGFCLEALPNSAEAISLVEAVQELLMAAKPEILEQDKLHEFVDDLQLGLDAIHNKATETYF